MALREYVFKTSSGNNLLCRWTREDRSRWILIQLLRGAGEGKAEGALFTLHAPEVEVDRFLKEDFGKRYGTFRVLNRRPELVSVEVTNYLLPAYRGSDPVVLATRLLGPDVIFAPILVHEGYIHVRVFAAPPAESSGFPELLKRITSVARPEEFQLIHTGNWDPLQQLKPRTDRLTDRQLEVLKIAIEFGYYDEPRRCKLEDVARAFNVSKAAVHKHLVGAEAKIMKSAPALL